MKKKGKLNKFYHYSFPQQAVLVTCVDKKGKTNIITVAWHTTISKSPPLYGVSLAPKRYSYELIKETKQFIVNFVPYTLIEKLHYCGTHSGRNIDKLKETGLNLEKIEQIDTPIIKECYAHLVCKLDDQIKLGDHVLLVGEVMEILSDEETFQKDILNNEKIQPCFYLGDNKYTTTEKTRREF